MKRILVFVFLVCICCGRRGTLVIPGQTLIIANKPVQYSNTIANLMQNWKLALPVFGGEFKKYTVFKLSGRFEKNGDFSKKISLKEQQILVQVY